VLLILDTLVVDMSIGKSPILPEGFERNDFGEIIRIQETSVEVKNFRQLKEEIQKIETSVAEFEQETKVFFEEVLQRVTSLEETKKQVKIVDSENAREQKEKIVGKTKNYVKEHQMQINMKFLMEENIRQKKIIHSMKNSEERFLNYMKGTSSGHNQSRNFVTKKTMNESNYNRSGMNIVEQNNSTKRLRYEQHRSNQRGFAKKRCSFYNF
jgi:ElaB/YqjD/DUF883 family membrane-anchored ribosome-binding protein